MHNEERLIVGLQPRGIRMVNQGVWYGENIVNKRERCELHIKCVCLYVNVYIMYTHTHTHTYIYIYIYGDHLRTLGVSVGGQY